VKKVLVIGATSAIATAFARIYAAQGASLFLVGRREEAVRAVADDLATRGAESVASEVQDLDALETHETLLTNAHEVLGSIDLVLIAHGTLGDQSAAEADWQETERLLRTNFLSTASLLTHLANRMAAQGAGTIAVISSVAGDRGRASNYVYGTAKAATTAFLSGLRNRLAKTGVHVLTIKPGFVATPMTAHLPQGPLFASPEQVARGIVRAVAKKRNDVYLPWFWRPIMLIIRMIPEPIFKRLKL